MSAMDQLCYQVREIYEDGDLQPMNMRVEQIKTHTFGISYFVPDPVDESAKDNN